MFRRLHNITLVVFVFAIACIIFFPVPKQSAWTDIISRPTSIVLVSNSPSSTPSNSSSTSSTPSSLHDIITQLNSDRLLAETTSPLSPISETPESQKQSQPLPSVITEAEVQSLLQKASNLQSNPKTTKKFILFRAIGNDLPPRHVQGQSYSNLKFILENEPTLPDLDVRWYLNRIVNQTEQFRIITLLIQHNQYFTVDMFNFTHYHNHVDFYLANLFNHHDVLRSHLFSDSNNAQSEILRARAWDTIFDPKNQYIIHNNQARNQMLRFGKEANANYILPWDGNCFLNKPAWTNITSSILKITSAPSSTISKTYFYVPMVRLKDNEQIRTNASYLPSSIKEEPQLIFHRNCEAKFDESKPYGYRPKVDLLWRLRIPRFQFMDRNGTVYKDAMSWKHVKDIPGYDSVQPVGWTARLFSGNKQLEKSNAAALRGMSRSDGVELIASRASLIAVKQSLNYSRLWSTMLYDRSILNNLTAGNGGNKYPSRIDTLERALKLAKTENVIPNPPSSTDVETHRTKSMKVTAAKFASFVFASAVSAQRDSIKLPKSVTEKATRAIRAWFIDESALDPSSVRDPNTLIHVCVALDAVRLFYTSNVLSESEISSITTWAQRMLSVLDVSSERKIGSKINAWRHIYFSQTRQAVLYEVGIACIASFTGDFHYVIRHTALARLRLRKPVGGGVKRVRDIVPWVLLATVAQHVGVNVWTYGKVGKGRGKNEERSRSLLQDTIRLALNQAAIVDSELEMNVAAWMECVGRKMYGPVFNGYREISEGMRLRDEEIIGGGGDTVVDSVIPPFLVLGMT